MNIWVISFLVVWVIGNVVWNYKFYQEKKFLCVGVIFQGLFAGVPSLIVTFSEWMAKYKFWTKPIFMNKELKADIQFLKAEQKARMEAFCKNLAEELDKKKDVIQENIDEMTPSKKKKLKKVLKGKAGKIK